MARSVFITLMLCLVPVISGCNEGGRGGMFELKKGVGGRAAGYLEYFDSQIERFMDGFDV